jgi:hypothetical protein
LILPEDWLAPVMPTTIDRSVLETIWSKRRSLCQSVRAARPQEGTVEETAAVTELVQLAFDLADAIGPEFLVALRTGVERGLMVILEAGLRDAPIQRKVALRQVERALETFGLRQGTGIDRSTASMVVPEAGRSCSGGVALDAPEHFVADGALGKTKVVVGLKAEPELGRHPEVPAQTQRGIGGDTALAVDDRADPTGRHGDVTGEAIHADSERSHEFLQQDFARMNQR